MNLKIGIAEDQKNAEIPRRLLKSETTKNQNFSNSVVSDELEILDEFEERGAATPDPTPQNSPPREIYKPSSSAPDFESLLETESQNLNDFSKNEEVEIFV